MFSIFLSAQHSKYISLSVCLLSAIFLMASRGWSQTNEFDNILTERMMLDDPYHFYSPIPYNTPQLPNYVPTAQIVNQDFRIVESTINWGDNEWTTTGPYGGGMFGSLSFDPNHQNVIYALSNGIGLYKSVDGGNSWMSINSLEQVITHSIKVPNDFELVPSQPNTIYAFCHGLYSSNDGGTTWQKMGIDQWGYQMWLNPVNPQTVFMTSWDGLYRTRDGGQSWEKLNIQLTSVSSLLIDPANTNTIYAGENGLWKSLDGGDNWFQLTAGLPSTSDVIDLAFDPTNNNLLYAGLSQNKGLYKSNNAGNNWTLVGLQGHSINKIAIDPFNPQRLLVSTTGGLFLTENGGGTWNLVTSGLPPVSLAAIQFDPFHQGIACAGSAGDGLYQSSDGGQNWAELNVNSRNGIYSIAFALDDSNIVYAASPYSGIFKSSDRGKSWERKNKGLVTRYTNSVVVHPQNSDIVYSPYGNKIYKSTDGGENWQPININVSLRWMVISPLNPDVFYGGEQGLFRSTDGGQNWELLGFQDQYLFEPIVFHPMSPDTCYIAVYDQGIYRTTDGGLNWEAMNNGMPVALIRDIAVFPDNPNIMYVSSYKNGIYRTDNGGEQWYYTSFAGHDIWHLEVDVKNPDLVYLGIFGYGLSGNVYFSMDGAKSWVSLREGLESTELYEFLLDPHDRFHLVVGTYRYGIWETTLFGLDHDVAIQSIVSPENTIGSMTATIPRIQLANYASLIESNFDVTCLIEQRIDNSLQEVYRNTKTIATLDSFEQDEVAFDPFTPPTAGNYRFRFFHHLANDANRNNDTLSADVRTALFADVSHFAAVADAGSGFGAAVADYDLDGQLDIFHTKYHANTLFHKEQNGTFHDRTSEQGLQSNIKENRTAGWFDYDNDGDPDLIVANTAGVYLYRNERGHFTDVSSAAHLDGGGDNLGMAIGDYNNDGYLDVYVTRYGQPNLFYSNNGDGTFSEKAAALGLRETDSNSASANFWDFDRDGDQDLLVVNHTEDNHLFRNNGNGTFTEIAGLVGIALGGNAHHALIIDYNNDGWLDLYLINSQPNAQANLLLRNDGGTFANVTESVGVGDAGDGYGGAYGDFDNDGYVDFYVVNADGANVFYQNNGDGTFSNIAYEAGVDNSNNSQGAVAADFDNDGDLDIYLVNNGQENVLYYNSASNNNWLKVKAEGKITNRDGVGALIEVVADGKRFTRFIDGNPGWGSQSSLMAEFGLGQATTVDSLIIRWPSGIKQDTTNIAINQTITVVEPALEHDLAIRNILSPLTKGTIGVPIYPQISIKNWGLNEEVNFNVTCIIDTTGVELYRDIQQVTSLASLTGKNISFLQFVASKQGVYNFTFSISLMSDQKSTNDTLATSIYISRFPLFMNVAEVANASGIGSSSGVAFGDYNNDNYLDIFIADYGDRNVLYKNNGNGTFNDVTSSARVTNPTAALACAFADYNNDGYQDLCINDEVTDVLYQNRGNGTFSNVTSLAGVGGTGFGRGVAFADYDHDGYLDLYFTCDGDRLFKNNGNGTFTNVTSSAGIKYVGYNTGVTFGDYDNDGYIDIFVANGNTNPLYHNNGNGTFTDVGLQAGVKDAANPHGVAFGDYDNDGYLDLYIACGYPGASNTLYHNNGNGTFNNTTNFAGVGYPEGTCRGVAFLDYDYDGFLDIFITDQHNDILFHNNRDGKFTDISEEIGIIDDSDGWGAAVGDYDNDGDLDIYVVNGDKSILHQNQGTPNNYLMIKTVGTISNRDGIGSRVKCISKSFSQIREVNGGSGLGSQNMLPVAFGLGKDAIVDSLIIRWPSGIRQISTDISVNQFITIIEDSTLVAVKYEAQLAGHLPRVFKVSQNYPNPFNPETRINYQLPKPVRVSIKIFNYVGQDIKTLIDEEKNAGYHNIIWDGRDNYGRYVASGIYLCQFQVADFVEVKKLVLIR